MSFGLICAEQHVELYEQGLGSNLSTACKHWKDSVVQCVQAIYDKYGVATQQMRVYIHYHPSYYHLHVHFMHVNVDAGAGMAAGKAHLLDDIIGECRSNCSVKTLQ